MRSVEEEYKMTKIKSAIKLYNNDDSTMSLVRAFKENAAHQGHQSVVKEARTFAQELGITLDSSFPHPKCRDNTDGAGVHGDKIKRHFKKAVLERRKTKVMEKRWQGKLLAARWKETSWTSGDALHGWRIGIRRLLTPLPGCSSFMNNWHRQRSTTHVRPVYINPMTPYVVYVAKLPKVSLMC